MRRLLSLAAVIPVLLATMAACGDDEVPAPFAGCDKLTSPAGAVAAGLPDLRLDCFTGDTTVALREVRGPAVINLWASWCEPCREELPVVQQLADRAGDKLLVLGVDTGDDRAKGAEFATDREVTMPTLFDPDRKLLNAVGRITLPVTVFVDANGKSYVHPLPMDQAGLAEQVRLRTGVTVTP